MKGGKIVRNTRTGVYLGYTGKHDRAKGQVGIEESVKLIEVIALVARNMRTEFICKESCIGL